MALHQLPIQWKQQLQPFRSSLFPHTSVPSSNLLSCGVAGLLPPAASSSSPSSSSSPHHLHIPSIADDILTAMLAAAPSASHYGSDIIPPVKSTEKRPFSTAFPESSNEIAEEDGNSVDDNNMLQQEEKRGRRLTNEQVRALEKAFDEEVKLEPDRKAKLAKDLGLQQRQVAIWFQNRRARWKTKQMEKEFSTLKQKYESMKVQRDALLHEKQKLQAEVAWLKKDLRNTPPPCSPSYNEDFVKGYVQNVINPSSFKQNGNDASVTANDNSANAIVEVVENTQQIENVNFDQGEFLVSSTSLLDLPELLNNIGNCEPETFIEKFTMRSNEEELNGWFLPSEWWN